ncbi:DUF3397 domain-containing protein [Paenilisteria rocourtiae]|uniref:Uncharacterized protein DUF3397 n=1 Tax=Listeria rocourtiae TaxID=647910 RepID=A0A4R6ZS75_9LIST|nr:DUF3397 domain-containing protein [Listeria rocourtiae]EUJ45147.1 hypothetical protein PROCOU_12193 [Listeria rocourtiae FSL F6-920]TDR55398.1 uncharacterized protein DUF3397 [Listeria rocourtiae]
MNWLTNITALVIVSPVLIFTVTFMVTQYMTKRTPKAVKRGADVTTFFLILAVHFFMIVLFDQSFLLYILLFLFLIGILFVALYAKLQGDINFRKVIRGYWRICFFAFAILYLLLFVVGIVKSLLLVF